jgi:N utilization substance protein A
MDPESRQTHVLVAEDQLSLAIGKEGQNVRLAARLTGWKIDIKDKAKYDHGAEDTKFVAVRAKYQPEDDENEMEELEYENQEELELEHDRFGTGDED